MVDRVKQMMYSTFTYGWYGNGVVSQMGQKVNGRPMRDAACNMNSCIPIGIAPSWMSIDFCSIMLYPGCAAMEGLPAGCISVVQQGPEDLH